MTTDQERQAIVSAYPSRRWQQKVVKMSVAQVHAVYLRLVADGKVRT